MYRLAYNANGLRNMDIVHAIQAVASHKYDGIELSLHKAHLHPFTATTELLDQIKDALEENNLEVSDLATGASDLLSDEEYEPSLITCDKEGREERIRCIKKSIEIAKYLGIQKVNISSGFRKDDISAEDAMKNLVDGIKECLQVCDDIILAIEPEPGMFVGTTEKAIKVIEAVGSDQFKLNLDIGHVVCCEEDYLQKIRNAVKYTVHTHIEDIKDKVHYHLIPGDGDVDLKAVLTVLKEENYEEFISVELYHHSDVYEKALTESHSYLSRLMKELND